MTAKEKAEELVNKFAKIQEQIEWTKDKQLMELCGERNDDLGEEGEYYWHELAKKSALIAVDEILDALNSDLIDYSGLYRYEANDYWLDVKHEIEKL